MTWFLVDDGFHSHSKARKVAARCPAALGLWVIAGSWSAKNLTDGFIPDDDLPWLLPDAETLATELVAARLWRRVKGGHQFHDWSDRNRTREQVVAERAAARERMQRLRSGEHGRSSAEVRANKRRTDGARSRPNPELPIGSSGGGARASPCPRHPGWPVDKCGGCRSEELSPP
jgi:hypothetical protein